MGRRHGRLVVGGHHRGAGAPLRPGVQQRQLLEHRRTTGRRGPRRSTGSRWWRAPRGWPSSTGQRARWISGCRSSRTGRRTEQTTSRSTAGEGPGSARWLSTSVRGMPRCTGSRQARPICVVDGLTISNGPAFDEVRGRLYLADTALCVVDVFDLDPETGALSGRRRFLDFSDEQVWPDGMTRRRRGNALGRAGAGRRGPPVPPGRCARRNRRGTDVATRPPSPSADRDGEDLYITTSWTDLDEHSRAAQPLAGAIFRCRPGVAGRPSERLADLPATAHHPGRILRERDDPMIERMVLLGASGDLTSRLLLPAIAQLAEAGLLPPGFTIVGAVQRGLVN